MKKYEFTGETKEIVLPYRNAVLHRIRAITDFGTVKVGDLGGWIEKEENLSHEGNAWVRGDAKVYGNAKVCDNAEVYGNAKVYDNAKVCDNAEVRGDAVVCGDAVVRGDAKVYDNAEVYGNAVVYGNAEVRGDAVVCGDAEVRGDAVVCGDAEVYGNAVVCGDAEIFLTSQVLTIGPIGSRNGFTTFYRDKDNEITVKCGCFLGKMEQFLEKVEQTHRDSKHGQVYRAAAEIARLQIDLSLEKPVKAEIE